MLTAVKYELRVSGYQIIRVQDIRKDPTRLLVAGMPLTS